MESVVRALGPDDARACAALIRRSFADVARDFGLTPRNCPNNGAFIRASRLLEELRCGHRLYGLLLDGELAGCMALADMGDGRYALEKLAVPPERRRAGHGTRLLDFAGHETRLLGGRCVLAGIIEANARLKQWYLRRGFVAVGTRRFAHLPFVVGCLQWNLDRREAS